MQKEFSAMILAAGFGKRLLPLTDKIPKPLVKVNNISLLKNSIDLLFNIGCKKIVINTHFKHQLISNFVKYNYNNSNITVLYEKNILETGGGVKNAVSLFDHDNILVTNSDIFWTKKNIHDIIKILADFNTEDQCRLLLVPKDKANGISKRNGDFSLNNNLVKRWKMKDEVFYYSGLQIVSLNILKNIKIRKFSFNSVWDKQIENQLLFGNIMNSQWYHVGDLDGLDKAIKANT